MTTAEIYRPPSSGSRTTPEVSGPIAELSRLRRVAANFEFVPALSTAVEARNARLRTELAERSIRTDAGIDRDFSAEIDPNAWGISGE